MSTPIEKDDSISQRITKLLPADITAALLGVKGALSLSTTVPEDWLIYGGFLIAALSPVYFWVVLETRNVLHIGFLVISYLIFFMSIAPIELGNFFPSQRTHIEGLNVIVTPIWVFMVTPIVAKMLGKRLVG